MPDLRALESHLANRGVSFSYEAGGHVRFHLDSHPDLAPATVEGMQAAGYELHLMEMNRGGGVDVEFEPASGGFL